MSSRYDHGVDCYMKTYMCIQYAFKKTQLILYPFDLFTFL